MGVITGRCGGIPSLLYAVGYNGKILMKSIDTVILISKGELLSLRRYVLLSI